MATGGTVHIPKTTSTACLIYSVPKWTLSLHNFYSHYIFNK